MYAGDEDEGWCEADEAYAEAEAARWDDDPSPYDGTYSDGGDDFGDW